MRYTRLRLVAVSAVIVGSCFSAHATLVANLPLTCLNPSAVGLHQNSCSGMSYQLPNSDQLAVLGADFVWSTVANVANTDTIAVCTLPVEPGVYSSCRDASGTRRIAFVAKSQIFASPPPQPSGAHILDLNRTPVQIAQPGVYVLNRNWATPFNVFPYGAIHIASDDVTLDLQGFELFAAEGIGISSVGRNVVIRNGSVRGDTGLGIEVTGNGTRIENMTVRTDMGGGVSLSGVGSVLSDSVVTGNEGGAAVYAGFATIVRDNSIFSQRTALSLWSSRATAVGNDVANCAIGPCITVEGDYHVVQGNRISMIGSSDEYGLIVVGNHNLVLGNVFGRCDGSTAILITGLANVFKDNLVPRSEPQEFGGEPRVCGTGIEFQRDGNFYGDNIVWATVPFNVGATVQTDLGGNAGFDR